MPDEMVLLTRLYLLTLWHGLAVRGHEPDFILLGWRWECRGCTFSRMYG